MAAVCAILYSDWAGEAQVINFDVEGGYAGGPGNYSGPGAYADLAGNTNWNAAVANGTTAPGLLSDGVTASLITFTESESSHYDGGGNGTPGTPSGLEAFYAYANNGATRACSLNHVPSGTYSLYLYGKNDNGGDADRGTTFTVSSDLTAAMSQSTVNSQTANTAFIQGNDYVLFKNDIVVGAGETITFTYTANAAANAHHNPQTEGDFNGLQLVSVSTNTSTPPIISGQPASVNLGVGSPAELFAQASGVAPITYQWQKGTNGIFVNSADAGDVSGSQTNVLNFGALTSLDGADYRLIVTDAFGSATSQVASVTVTVPHGYNSQRIALSYNYVTNYSDWGDAFLAGNGQMGIMVFGNPLNDTIIYNDRGFNMAASTNSPIRTFAQVSAANLAAIKSNCVAGNFSTADNLAASTANWNNGGEGNRHPGFEMLISIPPNGAVSNYSRVCNFETGEIAVNWSDGLGNWTRKSFVSRQDNVTIQYLPAPSGGTISCSLQLTTDPGMNFASFPGMIFAPSATSNFLNMRVNYPANTGGAGYEGVVRVVTSGGTVSVNGSVLNISNAASVMLLTRTAKYYTNAALQWSQQNLQHQLVALPADYTTLLDGQIATHQAIFDRVKINLNASLADRARANEDLLNLQATSPSAVKALWERIFDAGRYYYLSSSSSNTPPDLLGIWTADANSGFGGFYNTDANVNVQIGGGNVGDMPEAMAGYFQINEDWQAGQETNALKLLGCRGMVACGNTPGTNGLISSISTYYPYQYATGEEGWLLYPFWEHYLITGDTNFLANNLYPLLHDMGLFYQDFLTAKDTNGNYILAGSVSPENQPSNLAVSLVNNSTFDIAGAKFALSALIQTCNTLGIQQGAGQGGETWSNLLSKLPPYLINSDGALQEWSWPGLNDNYNHRHSSHLITVWPLGEITPENTPSYFNAAAITAAHKDAFDYENAGHGWVHSALIAAGLKDAIAVNNKILYLLQQNFYFNSLASSHYNNHSVFCTDTCHAMPAIMMEMLVSSGPGVLELLPALPQTLDQGAISGVKGRNRVALQSLAWNIGTQTVNCTLQSDIDQSITLIERSGINTMTADAAIVSPSSLGQIARTIQLHAGVPANISIGLGQINLALGRPVTVSSALNNSPGSNAVDGSAATVWTSASTPNEWIYVDLGSVVSLTGARLTWGAAYGRSYDIQVSNDATSWTNVFETPLGRGGVDRITFVASARYVRMLGVQSGGSQGYSLSEFAVYGNPTPGQTPAPQILQPPRPARLSVYPMQTAQFTVTATSPLPIQYQWQFNNSNLIDGNNPFIGIASGSTSNTLTMSNFTAGAGSYDLDVVVSNANGSSTSPVAVLTILPAPRPVAVTIGKVAVQGVGLTLSGISGAPFGAFQVLTSTQLNSVTNMNWTAITNGAFDGSGNFNVTVPYHPGDTRRFYSIESQ